MDDERAALEALIHQRREDYAGLSRLIGRNAAYIHQYVKRGTPRRLAEQDRATLARYFGVDEAVLGGPAASATARGMVEVPRLALGASAGPGALGEDESARSAIGFPRALLREFGLQPNAALSLIRVAGDSMHPTLSDGDDILVDRDDGADRLREGIYVLRVGDALLVKRIVLRPGGGIDVLSDNPASPDWADVDRAGLQLIGRVAWAGRRVR